MSSQFRKVAEDLKNLAQALEGLEKSAGLSSSVEDGLHELVSLGHDLITEAQHELNAVSNDRVDLSKLSETVNAVSAALEQLEHDVEEEEESE